jgi:hypothetical protein
MVLARNVIYVLDGERLLLQLSCVLFLTLTICVCASSIFALAKVGSYVSVVEVL